MLPYFEYSSLNWYQVLEVCRLLESWVKSFPENLVERIQDERPFFIGRWRVEGELHKLASEIEDQVNYLVQSEYQGFPKILINSGIEVDGSYSFGVSAVEVSTVDPLLFGEVAKKVEGWITLELQRASDDGRFPDLSQYL